LLQIVRLTLEAVYVAAHFLAPYLPVSATLIFQKLGTPQVPIPTLSADFINLKPGTQPPHAHGIDTCE
jgi:methionyl-tRNA synthetase